MSLKPRKKRERNSRQNPRLAATRVSGFMWL